MILRIVVATRALLRLERTMNLFGGREGKGREGWGREGRGGREGEGGKGGEGGEGRVGKDNEFVVSLV